MADARTYKIQATALLTTSGSGISAVAITAPNGTVDIITPRMRSPNKADAILKCLIVAVAKVSRHLVDGDHLDIEIGMDITTHLPQIARANGVVAVIGRVASNEVLQMFRADMHALHLRGVGYGLIEIAEPKGPVWSKLDNHCQMALAMSA
jgi:hypothetical protein